MFPNKNTCILQGTRKVELVASVSPLAIYFNKYVNFLKAEYLMQILMPTNINVQVFLNM